MLILLLCLVFLFACNSKVIKKDSVQLKNERYLRGYLLTPTGSDDCNPCVNNVIESVKNLRNRGETLGFNWGDNYPELRGNGTKNHWQGIQRLPLMGLEKPYFVVSSSHRYRNYRGYESKPAYFAVVEMASRGTLSGRLRSNRLQFGKLTRDVSPDLLDRIVKANLISPDFYHPGAMQAIGKYLLVGVDGCIGPSRNTSLLTLWDMSKPTTPKSIWERPGWKIPGRTAVCVAITKLEEARYLLVRAWTDAKRLDFYILDSELEKNPANYHTGVPWHVWEPHELKSELYQPDGTLDFKWADFGFLFGKASYQNLNLVTECQTGKLYLIASHGRRPSGFGGADVIEAFQVDVPEKRAAADKPGGVIITKVAKKYLYPAENAGARQGDLQAAAGIYISRSNELFFYATEHGVSGKGGFVTMIEFGPQIPIAEVTSIDKAWVELYDKKNFEGRSIILDYIDRNLRDYNDLKNIESFDNKASSVIYAIPKGASLRLFNGSNHQGAYFDLTGTGQPERIEDFAKMHLSAGETADNKISSIEWRSISLNNSLSFKSHSNSPQSVQN